MADVDLDFLAGQIERLISGNARIKDDLRVPHTHWSAALPSIRRRDGIEQFFCLVLWLTNWKRHTFSKVS
jgi:hypothetical protein